MPQVTFTFDTEQDAPLIKSVVQLLDRLPGDDNKPIKENKTVKETKLTKVADPAVSFAEFKKAAKEAKSEHGEDFVSVVLDAAGVDKQSTLLKTVSHVEEPLWSPIMDAWKEGPDDSQTDDSDDWEDEIDKALQTPKVDPESVILALRAASKEKGRDHAKEIMSKHGADNLTAVRKCSDKQLTSMMKDLV